MHALPFLSSQHESATLAPRDFGHDGQVSAVRTEDLNRRSTDASKLTFPLQLVLLIGGAIIATTGAYWLANFQVRSEMAATRSDMRDLKTTLDGFVKYQGAQMDAFQREQEDLKRKEALDAVRIEETRVIVAEIKGFMTATGMKSQEPKK